VFPLFILLEDVIALRLMSSEAVSRSVFDLTKLLDKRSRKKHRNAFVTEVFLPADKSLTVA